MSLENLVLEQQELIEKLAGQLSEEVVEDCFYDVASQDVYYDRPKLACERLEELDANGLFDKVANEGSEEQVDALEWNIKRAAEEHHIIEQGQVTSDLSAIKIAEVFSEMLSGVTIIGKPQCDLTEDDAEKIAHILYS